MRTDSFLLALLTCLLCSSVLGGSDDERIWFDAKINGKRARLFFDSGAETFVLFREGAQRLGVKFTEPASDPKPPSGQVPAGVTEYCELSIEGDLVNTRFALVDMPRYRTVDFDGAVGWWGLRDNVFEIDAEAKRVIWLSEVPKKAADWLQFGIVTNSRFLTLELPLESGGGTLGVDTGSPRGADLSPERWRAWKALHYNQPVTLDAIVTLGDGLVGREEAWANELAFGPLVIRGVPVGEATPMEVALNYHNFECELGLTALKRLDFIVDGKRSVAYLRPKKTSPSAYIHNRLGAVFVPENINAEELVARVAGGSPAEESGVRDGDVLLKVNDRTVTRVSYRSLRLFSGRAGTKITLTLRRSGETFKTTAILRDILPPTADKK